jgi:transposase-like protein
MARRRHSPEFKQAAVKRMLAGDDVRAMSRELSVARSGLYEWRDKYLKGGVAALRGPGQPRKLGRIEPPPEPDELGQARAYIEELKRKIGQQQLELDFFQRALRQVGEKRRPSDGPGASSSTPKSRR